MNKSLPIKLIVIDLHGVISFGSYKNTCEWLAKKYGFDYEACYQTVYYKYFCRAVDRKISERQSFTGAAKELKIKESGEELRIKHLSYQILNRQAFRWALAKKRAGYKILLLSKNTPGQYHNIIDKFNLKKYFKVINTYYLNIDKKSEKMIKYILRKYKLKPVEILMIDDQEFNLKAAKKLGLKTILYQSFPDFLKKSQNILKN